MRASEELDPSATRRARHRAESRGVAAELPSAYWIDVQCTEVADIVRFAGGWLFDHVTAGWHVAVHVSAGQDLKPLQILGIRSQPAARDVDDVGSEVLFWGERAAVEGKAGPGLCAARYPLSIAARAFKAHALRAANIQLTAGNEFEFSCASSEDDVTGLGQGEIADLVVLRMTGRWTPPITSGQ